MKKYFECACGDYPDHLELDPSGDHECSEGLVIKVVDRGKDAYVHLRAGQVRTLRKSLKKWLREHTEEA